MNIGVIGAGTMGRGIAQIGVMNHCNIVLFDTNQSVLEISETEHKSILDRLINKGKLEGTVDGFMKNTRQVSA